MQPSQHLEVNLRGHPIPVIKTEQLDPYRKTLHRLTLEPSNDIPHTVIAKQQKDGWAKEFQHEIEAYEKLQDLQGTVIPHYFGQDSFNGVPALFLSEVAGTTLYDLARNPKNNIQEKQLKTQLEKALDALSKHNAVYWDPKLDNFLFCDNGDCKVMIVDLEQVTFPVEPRPREKRINMGNVSFLMSQYRDTRDPNRSPSPIDWSSIGKVRLNGPMNQGNSENFSVAT